jgi:glycosyltransferase involved in cell wall biosynthesis
VATEVAAIPEIVVPGGTGWLVPPDEPNALSLAIEGLIGDPTLRLAMGRQGRRRILEQFAFTQGIEHLAQRFGLDAGKREAA